MIIDRIISGARYQRDVGCVDDFESIRDVVVGCGNIEPAKGRVCDVDSGYKNSEIPRFILDIDVDWSGVGVILSVVAGRDQLFA